MLSKVTARLRGAAEWLRARLVPDLRRVWREWSTWLLALGSGFVTFVQAFPGEAAALWNMIPADMRGRVPDKVALGIASAMMLAALLAKHVAQKGKSDA